MRAAQIRLHVRSSADATRGIIVSEGLWDNRDFLDGRGVNTLTGADSVAPFGGAAFHDVRVWARADVARPEEPARTFRPRSGRRPIQPDAIRTRKRPSGERPFDGFLASAQAHGAAAGRGPEDRNLQTATAARAVFLVR